jgi:O-antigen/teichoic acid export membrane protein
LIKDRSDGFKVTLSIKFHSPYARIALVGIDQLIAATSNFLVVWLCLTSLQTEAFGRFSYFWSTIALFVVLNRALFGIPTLLDAESDDSEKLLDNSPSFTGTLLLGVVATFVTIILYVSVDVAESELWIIGLLLIAPLILLQDHIRYFLCATKKIRFAIFLDGLALFFILVAVIVGKNSKFIGWQLIFCLALGYLLASILFVIFNRVNVSLRKLWHFVKKDFHRRSRLVSDALLAWAFGLAAITLIRIQTGDAGLATYNGLIFLFGPVTLVTVFLTLGLQSEAVRTKGNLAYRHRAGLMLIAAIPILWMFTIDFFSRDFIERFLGESTDQILSYVTPFAVSATLGIGIEILNLFMRAHEKFGEIARLRLVSGFIFSIFILAIVYFEFGLGEIIWAMAITSSLVIIVTAALLIKTKTLSNLNGIVD